MGVVELLGFCLSIFGIYSIVQCLRFLLPCFIIPTVTSILKNVEQALANAVTTGAIPATNNYRVDLEILTSQFARMRIESRRSPGFFPQIWLAVRHGLTCRLYSLASRIGAVGERVEVAMDERHLSLHTTTQIVVSSPAEDTAIPMTYTAEPAPQPTVLVD